ncbi:MAG TPA: ABC transporter permease [Caldilineaceae bacterium]|nr:ABC transporter permease [Caldilineaceae bacterium]
MTATTEKTWFEKNEESWTEEDELFDDAAVGGDEKIYVASYWQLMWWRFLKHRMAVIGGIVIILLYVIALFAEFVAPYHPDPHPSELFVSYKLAPPTKIHLFDENWNLHRPFVYKLAQERDPETLRRIYTEDTSEIYPIRFFTEGPEYEMWGLFSSNIHLYGLGPEAGDQGLFLFGVDEGARDLFTRICFGARISLTIGLVSVVISLILGIILGGISGYYGGTPDNIIQRIIEFIRSVPEIPLIMALAAALPADWPVVQLYFGITVLLSFVGWTGLARVVRGRFLSLREEDFVMAARLSGSGEMRVILRHMLPSFLSHIIASLTLSIPGIILAETGLSFIGLGLRPPAISWGVLLQDAQKVKTVALAPWLLIPALAVILTVLAFNFLGDGIRDAADPYAK